MKTYVKPDGVVINQVSEGVYAASGTPAERKTSHDACYTTTARIHQTPETGREDYRIQVDAKHAAEHTSNAQRLVISFNVPVTYISSNGDLFSGDGTDTLTISYTYWNNENDNIGLGDVVVVPVSGPKTALSITGVSMMCAGAGDF